MNPTCVVEAEELVDAGPAEVAAHDDDPLAGGGQGDAEVGQGGGLALALARAGDLEGAHRVVEGDEVDGGAQRPVGLGRYRPGRLHGHQPALLLRLPPGDLGDEADHGDGAGDLLQRLLGGDRVVEVLDQEGQAHAQERRRRRGRGWRCGRGVGLIGVPGTAAERTTSAPPVMRPGVDLLAVEVVLEQGLLFDEQ